MIYISTLKNKYMNKILNNPIFTVFAGLVITGATLKFASNGKLGAKIKNAADFVISGFGN